MSSFLELDLMIDEVTKMSDYIPELAEGEDFETFSNSKSESNSKATDDSEKIIPLELKVVDNQSVPIKKSKKSKKKKVIPNKSNENDMPIETSEEFKVNIIE